ncbi:MAG: FAD-dependent oxidoreductase [Woeseiaceae bacterium]|nr:FAD-dependent oxidoreductase [Woeseiaceae bacterium]
MKSRDIQLGMGEDISRRDFLNGVSIAVGASLLPSCSKGVDIGGQDIAGYYPPRLEGMRGSHDGSFEVAHRLLNGAQWDSEDSGESYDLVVVGGGISGLSAAYFYRQAVGDSAKILILDNHDDFGGHAKRNEFEIDGRLLIGYGGTMLIEAPGGYPETAKRLISELGIDTQRFYTAYDQELYSSLGLARGTYFSKEHFGSDHLVDGDITDPAIVEQSPLSGAAKADLARLLADDRHYLDDMTRDEQVDYLRNTDYRTYLRERASIGDEALRVIEELPRSVWAIGIDALPARTAWSSAYPGFGDLELGIYAYDRGESEPNIFHFPDGNASIARLLVRRLIPRAAPGKDMEDIVTARFNYRRLDEPRSNVRIRLNSTATRVRHIDDKPDNPVRVTYVREGQARTVTAGQVVMACYHTMIPYLCPELPGAQRTSLSYALRAPLVYTNVLLRDWKSFERLGLHRISCPGNYYHRIMLDYPVSLGDYHCPKRPEEPIVLHMTRVPGQPGLSAREQFAAGQRDLLTTSFQTFERNVRDQLGRVLGGGGFDPARDIAAITVNRWPHGYAFGYDPVTDHVAFEPDDWPKDRRHWRKASKRFGNIGIAATDAASDAMTESAIEEAHRAVGDLTGGL